MKNKQREIKFRAWVRYRKNKYDKELREFKDKLYKRGERFGGDPYDYNIKAVERFEKEKGVKYERGFYYEYKMDYNPSIYGDECFGGGGVCDINLEINSGENVFMQYTGLKDKNKKEIYEGDIIEAITTNGIEREAVQDMREDYSWLKYAHIHCEVIGNIYENPNLWRKQNEK